MKPLDLQELLTRQHELQVHYETDPLTMDLEERIAYIRWNVLALENELHEALAEISWKPWTVGEPHIHRGRVVAELVDALHFLCNLLLAVAPDTYSDDSTPADRIRLLALEVTHGYTTKRARNIERRDEGYDGVRDKCSHCHRALDDVPVTVVDGVSHCGRCGAALGSPS